MTSVPLRLNGLELKTDYEACQEFIQPDRHYSSSLSMWCCIQQHVKWEKLGIVGFSLYWRVSFHQTHQRQWMADNFGGFFTLVMSMSGIQTSSHWISTPLKKNGTRTHSVVQWEMFCSNTIQKPPGSICGLWSLKTWFDASRRLELLCSVVRVILNMRSYLTKQVKPLPIIDLLC